MGNDEISTYSLSALGLSVSIVDFRNWLDIILIILSIVNILIIIFFKVKKYLKDKKIDDNEKEDLLNEISNLKDTIKKLNKEDM